MKNTIVTGIVVAMALGVVITSSTPILVSAQENLTSGGENTTAGGGNIVQQLKAAATAAELIDNKKMFIIACEPNMTRSRYPVHSCQPRNAIKDRFQDRLKRKPNLRLFLFFIWFLLLFF
jgi:hypothetical protein